MYSKPAAHDQLKLLQQREPAQKSRDPIPERNEQNDLTEVS